MASARLPERFLAALFKLAHYQFVAALRRAYVEAEFRRPLPNSIWAEREEEFRHLTPMVRAVARVALERAAEVAASEVADKQIVELPHGRDQIVSVRRRKTLDEALAAIRALVLEVRHDAG